jgi:hypothetical protein
MHCSSLFHFEVPRPAPPRAVARVGPYVAAANSALEAKLHAVLSLSKTGRGRALPSLPPDVMKHMASLYTAKHRWRALRKMMRFKWQRIRDDACNIYDYVIEAEKHDVPHNTWRKGIKVVPDLPSMFGSIRFIAAFYMGEHAMRLYYPVMASISYEYFAMGLKDYISRKWMRDNSVVCVRPGEEEPFVYMSVYVSGADLYSGTLYDQCLFRDQGAGSGGAGRSSE